MCFVQSVQKFVALGDIVVGALQQIVLSIRGLGRCAHGAADEEVLLAVAGQPESTDCEVGHKCYSDISGQALADACHGGPVRTSLRSICIPLPEVS